MRSLLQIEAHLIELDHVSVSSFIKDDELFIAIEGRVEMDIEKARLFFQF